MNKEIINIITNKMQRKGLTIYKLAKLAGLQQTQLKLILTGKSDCNVGTLESICEPLGLRIEFTEFNTYEICAHQNQQEIINRNKYRTFTLNEAVEFMKEMDKYATMTTQNLTWVDAKTGKPIAIGYSF